MKSRTIPLALTVVLLVTISGTAAAVSGSPDIDVTVSDDTVSPGEETTLDVVLVNSGDIDTGSSSNPSLNSDVTTARGLTVDAKSGSAPISVSTTAQAVGSLSTGSPETVSFDISVEDDADPGSYRVPIELDYKYYSLVSEDNGVRNEREVSKTRYVTIEVSDDATFDVVSVDSNAQVGTTGDVAVTIENTGETTANNTNMTLSSKNGEFTVGGNTESSRFIDSWQSGESRTFNYSIGATSDAEPEPYEFSLSAGFDNPDGIRKTSIASSIGIAPEPEQEFSLSDVSGTLRAGEDGTLEATLTNEGPKSVENVVLNWESDHNNLSPQETQYAVGDLEANASKTVSFDVDASDNAREGPRQFDFVANYKDDGNSEQSDTLEIQSSVGASQDEFALESANTTIPAGQSGTIDITITNTRDIVLSDISARLFADSPISAVDDEAFVSELGPGESTTLTFSVGAGGGALQKSYPISLDFQYEEPDGDTPVSDTYRVAIDVTDSGGGGGLPLTAIGGVVFVVVLAIGGYVRFS